MSAFLSPTTGTHKLDDYSVMLDGHTATSLADDGFVASDLHFGRTTDCTLHDDHAGSLSTGCGGELRQRANGSA